MNRRRYGKDDDYVMPDEYEYQNINFEERNYMQSALFDFDTESQKDYYDGFDSNPYITEGNNYFQNEYEYVDVEYSYEDASKYGGYYFDETSYNDASYGGNAPYGYTDNSYDNYYNNYSENNKGIVNADYSDVIQQDYTQTIHNTSVINDVNEALNNTQTIDEIHQTIHNTSRMNDIRSEVEERLADEPPEVIGTPNYSTDVYYAMDYANDDDASYGQKQMPALKYNNIPTQNIQFEESFIVDSAIFDDDENDRIISIKDIINLGACIILAFVMAYLIAIYGIQHTEVLGTSMDFNLKNEDVLIVDKFSYKFGKPKRFDIVVFPVDSGYYIKRIIGLPGETVRITKEDGKVYINDEVLEDDKYSYALSLTEGCDSMKLGDDEYFVLGDNRNGSTDSRSEMIGAIPGSIIMGKAVFRIFPFNEFGSIDGTINEQIKSGKTELAVDGSYEPSDLDQLETQVIDGEIQAQPEKESMDLEVESAD